METVRFRTASAVLCAVADGLFTLCRDAGADAGTVWGVMVAGVSFHACTDDRTSVLRLTPR